MHISSDNEIESCLQFGPPLCESGNAWSGGGHQALGSMLNSADLRNNRISKIGDISHHKLLEFLLLGRNFISKIEGISTLRHLKVWTQKCIEF